MSCIWFTFTPCMWYQAASVFGVAPEMSPAVASGWAECNTATHSPLDLLSSFPRLQSCAHAVSKIYILVPSTLKVIYPLCIGGLISHRYCYIILYIGYQGPHTRLVDTTVHDISTSVYPLLTTSNICYKKRGKKIELLTNPQLSGTFLFTSLFPAQKDYKQRLYRV